MHARGLYPKSKPRIFLQPTSRNLKNSSVPTKFIKKSKPKHKKILYANLQNHKTFTWMCSSRRLLPRLFLEQDEKKQELVVVKVVVDHLEKKRGEKRKS